MGLNFIYERQRLEAGELSTDREWFWTKGEPEIYCNQGGEFSKTIGVPVGAGVSLVKNLIRADAKSGR